MSKLYETRDPIHGFIQFNAWEREIINHPVFQRLRRIRQLGLTEMVYPGAAHTRFEHSLGVMHVATKLFDQIVKRQKIYLKKLLNCNDEDFARTRTIIRLAALLHDIGHSPFSHAGEGLMPLIKSGDRFYGHEDYSAAIIELILRDVIENHPLNKDHIKAHTVANYLRGIPALGRELLIWRSIVSSQLDADRADYLLRDSHHIGVAYGHFDLDRILITICVGTDPETEAPILVVEEGGGHAVEGLILARYMMFTQVYFQHTRRVFDYHTTELMKFLLRDIRSCCSIGSTFPPPVTEANIRSYLEWCDNRVWGFIIQGKGGEHGARIISRNHYRRIHETTEVPTGEEVDIAEALFHKFKEYGACLDLAESSWYKLKDDDISILTRDGTVIPLSVWSSFIASLKPVSQRRVYVDVSIREQAESYRDKLLKAL
ncbi:MAG: HD domain-containing protein [Firmicutes bacterium]|jgi:HD superfamily phosphohydrolase|nr:HD domain-containing protein [Bacillota bacterium]